MNFGDRFILPHYRSLGELEYTSGLQDRDADDVHYGSFRSTGAPKVFQIMRATMPSGFARMFTT